MAAILISATHSGAGKTTVTGVVMAALRRRGLSVQPFKVGPDFIDAAHHAEVCGRPSINLDTWLQGEDGTRRSFENWSAAADIAVIEAMGGLFDGVDGSGRGSPAELAKLLGVPVLVVLDVWGMTRTAAPILRGLRGFDPEVRIVGCVLNRVGSPGHAAMVIDSLPDDVRGLVVGSVAASEDLAIPERHLGIVTVQELGASADARAAARERAAADLDLDRIVDIAAGAEQEKPAASGETPVETTAPPSTPTPAPSGPTSSEPPPPPTELLRMAIARDEAFHFYYEENLELLRRTGFELVPFRPTTDSSLPPDVDIVYLGGGYPESFAAELAANESLVGELRERAAAGLPIYAECGGFIYLGRSLTGFDGETHAMTGVLPLDFTMDREHLSIAYVTATTAADSPLGPAGTTARGQEFHQSRAVASPAPAGPDLFDLTRSDDRRFRAGLARPTIAASYVHLHLASNPALAANLAAAARAHRR
ncbi:MAG TPA: cobyrinate a,c-diamide synthase [Solirubrobacterales bacterium]